MAAASPVGVYTGAGMAAYGFHRGSQPDGSHDHSPTRFSASARAFTASGLQTRARELDAPAADNTPASFTRVAADLVALADRHAGGRILVLGGGGYHDGLAAAWLAVVAALLGEPSCSRP